MPEYFYGLCRPLIFAFRKKVGLWLHLCDSILSSGKRQFITAQLGAFCSADEGAASGLRCQPPLFSSCGSAPRITSRVRQVKRACYIFHRDVVCDVNAVGLSTCLQKALSGTRISHFLLEISHSQKERGKTQTKSKPKQTKTIEQKNKTPKLP